MSLERFLSAQEHDYEIALSEIRNGRKQSHSGLFARPSIVITLYVHFSKLYKKKRAFPPLFL